MPDMQVAVLIPCYDEEMTIEKSSLTGDTHFRRRPSMFMITIPMIELQRWPYGPGQQSGMSRKREKET